MHEKTIATRTAFQGRLMHIEVVDVELDSGRRSTREIMRHPGAAVVLAQLDDGRFVFVRQFRKAVEKITLEVVAGTLHPGEDPVACAHRELREESGYAARELVRLGTVLPAPGYTTERLHLFYARLHPEQHAPEPDHDEQVEVAYLTAPQIEDLIVRGELDDGKSLAAWLLYKSRGIQPPLC